MAACPNPGWQAVRGVMDFAIVRSVRDAENVVEDVARGVEQVARLEFRIARLDAFEHVAQVNPGVFAFAARDDVDLRARCGFLRQRGNVRTTLHNRHIKHRSDFTAAYQPCLTCGVLLVMPTMSG